MSAETKEKDYAVAGYMISTDPALLDFDAVYGFLINESYWAQGLQEERFRRAVANSMCFAIYHDRQVAGFGRVITDKATFAYIADVFVMKDHRGKGLSKWLIHTMTTHPELQGIRRWSLATADAHGLYEQFGFSPLINVERWMQKYQPYTTENGG